MDWNRVEGSWRHLRGSFKDQWKILSDPQLDLVAGKRQRLVVVLQDAYHISQDEAEQRVKEWENSQQRVAAFEQVLRRTGELV